MPRFIIGLFAAVLFTAVCAGPSAGAPGDPVDPTGKVTGFVPSSQGANACVRYVNKRTTVFPLNCVMRCSMGYALAISKGSSLDFDGCEKNSSFSCQAQWDRAMGRLDQGLCPACLNPAALVAIYPEYRNVVKSFNGLTYCDTANSVPFTDGSGFASRNQDVTKCEVKVARAVNKALKCLNLHCHQKAAEALYWGKPAHLAFCEDEDTAKSCKARFIASTAKIVGCPTCLGATQRTEVLFNAVQLAVDSRNDHIYCGQ